MRFFEKSAFTKHTSWKYEQEWRYISYVNDINSKPCMKIGNSLISAIYLGLHISPENKENIIPIIKEKYPSTRIFLAKKNNKFIKLDFDEL